MNVIATIAQGANLIGVLGPMAIDAALALQKLFAGDNGTGFDLQIQAYHDGILKTVEETDLIIADWKSSHAL